MKSDKCRCLFCGEKSGNNQGKIFVSSTHKYGNDKTFWGVCHDCFLIGLTRINEEVKR